MRAAVARALVLAGKKELEQLAAFLAEHRTLLFAEGLPRERVLVRALQRLVTSRTTSAYREPAPEAGTEVPAHDDAQATTWLGRLAPDVAAFAPPSRTKARLSPETPTEPGSPEALDVVRKSRTRDPIGPRSTPSGNTVQRIALLWGLPAVILLVVWQFLSPTARHTPPVSSTRESRASLPAAAHLIGLLPLFLAGYTVVTIRRQRTVQRKLIVAARREAIGAEAEARACYEKIASNGNPVVAVQGLLQLAMLDERSAAFGPALASCERALALVSSNPNIKMVMSDVHVPELVAERAFLLAALDRGDEAVAEVDMLTAEFPGYPYMPRALFRVRVMRAVREGDLGKAAALAKERTLDMPLFMQDEVLADLLMETKGEPLPREELIRLRGELDVHPHLCDWLARVAPAVVERFERRTSRATR